MPRLQQHNRALYLKIHGKFSNSLPLIIAIRADIGPDWEFYKEFLEGVVDTMSNGEDTSAWFEHIEPLVKGQNKLKLAHEGICFLFREVKAREQRAALPLLINKMPPPPRPLCHSFSSLSNATTLERGYVNERLLSPPMARRTSPTTTPTSAVFSSPEDLHSVTSSSQALKNDTKSSELSLSVDPILFTDPSFKLDICNFFGVTGHRNSDDIRYMGAYTAMVCDRSELAPTYNAKDDDLHVWKKRIESDSKVKDNNILGEGEGYGDKSQVKA